MDLRYSSKISAKAGITGTESRLARVFGRLGEAWSLSCSYSQSADKADQGSDTHINRRVLMWRNRGRALALKRGRVDWSFQYQPFPVGFKAASTNAREAAARCRSAFASKGTTT
jgi:hypothetical protein